MEETASQWFIASTVSSMICCLLFYPLECVEGVLQISRGRKSEGFFGTMARMYKEEGLQSLFKGFIPATLGAGLATGVYFTSYQVFKSYLAAYMGPVASQMLGGVLAGVIGSFASNPFLVWKMRTLNAKTSPNQSPIDATFQVLRNILKQEGVLGLWAGIGPSLLGVFEGAIQLTTYDKLNAIYYSSFINGALSKVFAVLCTYPYQFLRSRMQADSSYASLSDCVKKVYANEGALTFYTGMGPNIARSILPTALFFYLFEFIKSIL